MITENVAASAPVHQWIPHQYGYGETCSYCGYHGRTQAGRAVHMRRGCPPNAKADLAPAS